MKNQNKIYKISGEDLKELVPSDKGGCYATDMVTVEGMKIGYMYREDSENYYNSGWRMFSGRETQEYADDADNTAIYKLNTIANYDPAIIPYLDYPIGSQLERIEGKDEFKIVED